MPMTVMRILRSTISCGVSSNRRASSLFDARLWSAGDARRRNKRLMYAGLVVLASRPRLALSMTLQRRFSVYDFPPP
jgi:hypothetical protein